MMELCSKTLCNINLYFGIWIRKVGRKGGGEALAATMPLPFYYRPL